MELRNNPFDYQTAMFEIASSTNEAIVQQLELNARKSRITEAERSIFEEDALVEVLRHPLRHRVANLHRINVFEAVDWNKVQKTAQATAAALLIGTFTLIAGNKLADYWNNNSTVETSGNLSSNPRTPLAGPDGRLTPEGVRQIQINRHRNSSVWVRH